MKMKQKAAAKYKPVIYMVLSINLTIGSFSFFFLTFSFQVGYSLKRKLKIKPYLQVICVLSSFFWTIVFVAAVLPQISE